MGHKTYISPGVSEIVIQDYMEALRSSEARFRTIFEGATIGIALVDLDGHIVESNATLEHMLGLSRQELRHRDFTNFTPPEDADRCQGLFEELVAGKRDTFQMEKRYALPEGRLLWGRLTVSPYRDSDGACQFAIGMVEDITEQKQAEAEIRTYQEHLRSLASELSLAEERERRRIATELHDHVGQILALAQIKLGALKGAASSTNFTAPLDEIRRLIEQMIQYTRSLTFELSPPILYDLGFEAAVEWLAELFQKQHGITIQVQADDHPKGMGDEIKVLLFQAVRELLMNVVKHARADQAKVTISREKKGIRITVEDNGVGMSIPQGVPLSSSAGFGLFSIKERLKYLGGQLKVKSQPDQGTKVTLMVPLN